VIRYLWRRVLHAAAILVLISAGSFAFLELAPGDYAAAMRLDPGISPATVSAWRSRYGVDRPLPVRYFRWLGSILRGEFGFSLAYGIPVGSLLWPRIKNTLLLTTLALVASWSAALAVGLAAAAGSQRAFGNLIRGGISLLHAIPDVLIALVLLLFAVRTGIFSVGGMAQTARLGDVVSHLAMPVVALVLASLPVLARHVQAALQESLALPFIQAARAQGIPRGRLWFAYIFPAAANPLISLFGYSIGGLLSASLLVEVIMGWPGLGPVLLEAIFSRDVYVVVGATMVSALFLVMGNLIADLMLYAADPRIRWEHDPRIRSRK
jgi:peptide/nickel transport system permease protein